MRAFGIRCENILFLSHIYVVIIPNLFFFNMIIFLIYFNFDASSEKEIILSLIDKDYQICLIVE